jgi:hypothetical protein
MIEHLAPDVFAGDVRMNILPFLIKTDTEKGKKGLYR